VSHHAEPRYTKDLDFWVESSLANGKRILAALEEFGAPVENLNAKDLATPGVAYTAGLPRVPGGDFKAAFKSRTQTTMKGVPIQYVSREVLIELKKAAGRPQDKIDIIQLRRFGRDA
jgi:hypothetical protein